MKIYFFNFIDRLISICCYKKNMLDSSVQYQQISDEKIIDLNIEDNQKIEENNQ